MSDRIERTAESEAREAYEDAKRRATTVKKDKDGTVRIYPPIPEDAVQISVYAGEVEHGPMIVDDGDYWLLHIREEGGASTTATPLPEEGE